MDVTDNSLLVEPSLHAITTDQQLFSAYAKTEETFSLLKSAKSFFKEIGNCTPKKVKNALISTVPVLQWISEYKIKENLLNDFASGLTVGVVHLPQGLAYSSLAEMPPVNGLYTSFFPVLVYAFFGTAHHLSVGTFAVVSLMVADATSKHLPHCSDNMFSNLTTSVPLNTTSFPLVDESNYTCAAEEVNSRRVALAVALCLAVSIIHFIMFVFRLGILNLFFSSHMVSGFTCGAAFHVFTSQFPKLFGVSVDRKSGLFSIVKTYIGFFGHITTINWATVILAICCVIVLLIGKKINEKYSKKLPFPIPWELFVLIVSTLVSSYGYLKSNYDVSVVGNIPRGIKTSVPQGSDLLLVFVDAIPIAIVVFSISISLSSVFSEKHGYTVDSNQELLAFSLSNLCGSFFQCFPCGASLSRSLVWEQSGGKTQLTGVFSCILILVSLLWIAPLFEPLPDAALAAIIVVNLRTMLMQFEKLKHLWNVSKIDMITWIVTWLSVVLLGVDIGLYIGLGFSLFTVVLRTQITFGNIMVAVGPDGLYRSARRFDGVAHEDILVFKFPSPLIYANQARFKHQLSEALGFNPNFEIALQKKAKGGLEKKAEKKPQELLHVPMKTFDRTATVFGKNADYGGNSESESFNTRHEASEQQQVDVQDKQIASTGVAMPRYVVLDMSICPFIDNDGIHAITTLLKNLSLLNIRLLLGRCTADVRKCLLKGQFPDFDSNFNNEPIFFVSIDRAVEYANNQRKVTTLLKSQINQPAAGTSKAESQA